mgnify:CR=1 FL=1
MKLKDYIYKNRVDVEGMMFQKSSISVNVVYMVTGDRFECMGIYEGSLWIKSLLKGDGRLIYCCVDCHGKEHDMSEWMCEEYMKIGDLNKEPFVCNSYLINIFNFCNN